MEVCAPMSNIGSDKWIDVTVKVLCWKQGCIKFEEAKHALYLLK